MSLEDFFQNIRIAQRLLGRPRVTTDSPALDPKAMATALHQADLWLTPRLVSEYDPKDFAFLEKDERDTLDNAVEQFRKIAERVPPTEPATEEQATEARQQLASILEILSPQDYRSSRELVAAKALDQFKGSKFAPGYLKDVRFRFDTDMDGEVNLSIWLVLDDDIVGSPVFFEKARELRTNLGEWLGSFGVEPWPLIGFRSASEQRQLEELVAVHGR